VKRAFTFIVLAWFAAVVTVLATGCQKKASDASANGSVMDVGGGGHAQAQPQATTPVAPQPVVYDSGPAQQGQPMDSAPAAMASGSYTVKKGDTLYGIARQRYGDGKQWTRIAEANPGLRPETLKVGQTIAVP
jgi:5'-nucleotidase